FFVAQTTAWLHYYRYLLLPDGEDDNELEMAMTMFREVARVDPAQLPDDVRLEIAGETTISADYDPERQFGVANLLVEWVDKTDDRISLNRAIELLAASVLGTPADHPDYPVRMLLLCNAFCLRYERAGVDADLDEAEAVARTATAAVPPGHPE